jgi:hypothetical protein
VTSVATVIQESFTVNCSLASFHDFTLDNSISPFDVHVSDPDNLNDSASTQITIPVTATADLKITAQSALNPPASFPVNTDTVLTFEKTVHNNGPYTPVDADVTATLSAPPDCTVTPDPLNPGAVNGLATSIATVIQESFTVNCSLPSSHDFTLDNSISPSDVHVSDPDNLNDSASTQISIPVCPADQDPDGDGVCTDDDNCPDDYNPGQQDDDGDGLGNPCDNCSDDFNPGQENADGDDWGDVCDNCPGTSTPWLVPLGDSDCDAFTDVEEGNVGTDPADWCPDDPDDDAWPSDLSSGLPPPDGGPGKHDGTVNILDIVQLTPPVFGASPPNPLYSIRKDFNADNVINILDIVKLFPPMFSQSCTP